MFIDLVYFNTISQDVKSTYSCLSVFFRLDVSNTLRFIDTKNTGNTLMIC